MTWKEQLAGIIRARWRRQQKFTLREIRQSLWQFKRRYPDSTTLDDSLRFWLQRLRDDGVIEFVDYRGTYRRLT